MTENELRAKFNQAYRIVRAERRMRSHVFRNNPATQEAKVAEMDRLLTIVTEMKDALKEYIGDGVEQMRLIEPPARYE